MSPHSPLVWPARPVDGHKGTFGHALIVGGSRGMSGAAALAGMAALRGGAGLVSVAVGTSVLPIVAAIEPSYMTIALPEDSAGRVGDAWALLQSHWANVDAVALGPGLGRSASLSQLVHRLYADCPHPLIVDADGLNLLAEIQDWPTPAAPRILTPHPGEFARLSGWAPAEIAANREKLAHDFAHLRGVTVVLKGAHTVITDGSRVACNTTGNPGMATGGAGDVLSGLLAALLAQQAARPAETGQLDLFDTVRFGVHLHGRAGDLAAKELSEPGLIASDLVRYLPAAWRSLLASPDSA